MVVEKYTKALLGALNKEEVVDVYEGIARVALISNEPKFILLVKSPVLSEEEKVKLLCEVAENENPKLVNFFKILLENKRMDLIKEIHQNLYAKVAEMFNTYAGFVYGELNNDTLKKLEEKLSKKFDAIIKLQLKESNINGIKVFVDVLNVEVAISEDRIKQDLVSQILKAI